MFRTHFSQNIKSWPFPPRSSVRHSQRLCLFTCACALKPTNGRDYNEEMMMMMMTPPDMSNPIRTETQHLGTFSFRFGFGCQWPVEIYGFSTHDDDMVQLDGVLPVSNGQDMEERRSSERTGGHNAGDWFKLCVHCFHLEIISRDRGRETRLVKSSQWLRWIITP